MSDSSLSEIRDEAQSAQLRVALRAALRKYDELKNSREDYLKVLYEATFEAASSMVIPVVTAPPPDLREGTPEVAVVCLTDWQLGKRTPTYDSDIAVERVKQMADKVKQLVEIQRADHPVNDCHIRLLGDMVEGEMVFPGQAHLIDASLYSQTFRVAETIAWFVREMLAFFPGKVHVTAVIGNHGRLGRKGDYNLESNADRFAYKTAEMLLRDERRLTWNIPDGHGESSWYAIDRIGDVASMCFHGYNLKGHAGFPWYGLGKKVGGWALGAIEEWAQMGVTEIDFGHWHQPVRVPLNRVMAWCHGSTESTNLFAQENLAAMGAPSQGLRFVHPKRGTTAEYVVWLK